MPAPFDRRGLRASIQAVLLSALVPVAAAFGLPSPSLGAEILAREIIIGSQALHPPVFRTETEHRVTVVNRSGRMVHVEFVRDPEQHHVFHVPDQIWAVFHHPGVHRYVVHFTDAIPGALRGTGEVVGDLQGRPDPVVCGGVTVMGGCIER